MLRKTLCVAALVLHAASAFKQVESDKFLDMTNDPVNLSLIDEIGTAPCVFKVNNSFYDFTPIKIAYPNPVLPYYNGSVYGIYDPAGA